MVPDSIFRTYLVGVPSIPSPELWHQQTAQKKQHCNRRVWQKVIPRSSRYTTPQHPTLLWRSCCIQMISQDFWPCCYNDPTHIRWYSTVLEKRVKPSRTVSSCVEPIQVGTNWKGLLLSPHWLLNVRVQSSPQSFVSPLKLEARLNLLTKTPSESAAEVS